MEANPFYHQCCVTGKHRKDGYKIEWHHNLTWKGQRVNEAWCILPLWDKIHEQARNTEVKEKLDYIMWKNAPSGTYERYDKIPGLKQRIKYLFQKYGI